MFDLLAYLKSFLEMGNLIEILEFIIPQSKYALPVDPKILPINLPKMLFYTFIFLVVFGAVAAYMLVVVAARFAVKVDPRIEKVRDVLPGANCGACGYAGCQGYAEAVVTKADVSPNLCAPGKNAVAEAVAMITGKEVKETEPRIARVMCQGGDSKASRRFKYEGILDCKAAVIASGGDKSCVYGCLGYGTCVRACPFDAMKMGEDNLPVVDPEKCTACGNCARACPKNVIEILPLSKEVLVRCHSKDKGAATKKNCLVGCIGCGMCVKVCPYNAAEMTDNLARINLDKCKVCGLCARKCPTNAIMDYIPSRPKAFITEKCNGCHLCAKVCPVNAISGELKKRHVVDQDKCIGCGICTSKCPVLAIEGTINYPEVRLVFEAKKAERQKAKEAGSVESQPVST